MALLLPRQYNTNVYNASSTGTSACSANYFNTSDGTSDSSTTNTGTAVTGLSSCTVEGNEVTATFESGISGVTLDSGYRLDWKVNSLRNPAWTSEWNDSETSTGDLDNWY